MGKIQTLLAIGLLALGTGSLAQLSSFSPGAVWNDVDGNRINAHGPGILYQNGVYYWYGERRLGASSAGVNIYTSTDLYNWTYEGIALPISSDPNSQIRSGCKMERPKVIYNESTQTYVMWFHLELSGQGYDAAMAGVATASNPLGPFTYLNGFRPNNNMSRDQTLFVDDDGTAYQISAANDNIDLHVRELTSDYLQPTQNDVMIIEYQWREAPAVFKHNGKYFLITSGATGWDPNPAELHVADDMMGPWVSRGNPASGTNANITFDGQSAYVLPLPGYDDAFIFLADRWEPPAVENSTYIWLPIQFNGNDDIIIEWENNWNIINYFGAPTSGVALKYSLPNPEGGAFSTGSHIFFKEPDRRGEIYDLLGRQLRLPVN